ncbi:MAG: hypothetical protein IPI38_14300 [Gemmatimonadetes bacterium]|jgi:hypothetical protein|nr:hypothetical protein [Gemmatimonadota bacterium]MBP6668697.1 hypothetical protein [Gemmatimonadales bacterium]MBK7349834.1 hypothetical protein [Gemmatimonadota bacterium]MBK7716575.1 hypothetical protein [Gemmatimonadota bacterium]MBK7784464.1 hypothetical protein [Gemmatimonadota bacterium]
MSGQPWDAEKWASGRIEDDYKNAGCILTGLAVVFNVVGWSVALTVTRQNPGDGGALFVWLFPLVALGLAAAAVHQTLRKRRFGSPVFELATRPGVVGRALAGQVLVPRGLPAESDVKVTLKCLRLVTTGSGKNRRTTTSTLWEREQQLPGSLVAGEGLRIPVAFAIPSDAPPTDERNSRDTVRWDLEVQSALPGVDFKARFEVPVFVTPESARPLTDEERQRLGG